MRHLKCLTIVFTLSLLTGAAAKAGDSQQIDVSLGDVSINKVTFLVAADAGIYVKNGLNVHQFITPDAAEKIRHSGIVVPDSFVGKGGKDAAISIGGGVPMMYAMATDARAANRVILATTDDRLQDHIIVAHDITSLDQLKGKRLGYSSLGSVTHVTARLFAEHMGWDPDHDVSLMANGNNINALKSGEVDAVVGSELIQAIAAKEGWRDLVDLATYDLPLVGSSVTANRKWLQAHPDEAARFVKATVEAIALTKTNKQVVFDALAKWFNITDREAQQRMYDQEISELPKKPYPSVDGIKKAMEVYSFREMTMHPAEYYYDARFMADLDKSGFIDKLYTDAAHAPIEQRC